MNPALSNIENLQDIRKSGVKILIVTGASGGHIFPALSFIDVLRDQYPDTDALLVVPKKIFIDKLQLASFKVRYTSISSIALSLNFKNLITIWKFFKGSWESLCILLEFNPDVIVGFGSIVSLPFVLSAWIFRTKILIHEQNVIPGRANRLLANFAEKIAISFKDSEQYFPHCARKLSLTGNPIRQGLGKIDKSKARGFFGLDNDKFTILVMGGSQGSHRLNMGFLNVISMLLDRHKIQIIHLAGAQDQDFLKKRYHDLNINARLFSFLKEMEYAYSACDLLVSRAGATAISEAIFFRLPAIIIPYPFAYAHQLKNAKVLEKKGCGIIIKDNELDTDRLGRVLEDLLVNSDKIKLMRYNYDNMLHLDAANLLVKEAMSLVS